MTAFDAIGKHVLPTKTWNPVATAPGQLIDYIDLSAIDSNSKQISDVKQVLGKDAPSRARQLVKVADVLVSTVRPNLNGVAIVPEKLDGATASTGFTVLRANETSLAARYLYHWLKTPEFISDMVKKATGQSYPAVSDRIVLESLMPLPKIEEQRRIATILDQAEALRAKRRQALAKLDTLTQSLFLEMFGDPVRNHMGWEKKTAIDYADCTVPGRDKPKSFTGTTPWVTTADLQHLGYTERSRYQIGLSDNEIKAVRARVVPKGSVLLTCVGDLGVVSISETDMVINQQLHSFQMSDEMNEEFFMHALAFQKDYMYRNASQTTLPYMNKTICNKIPMIRPPRELQFRFAQAVRAIDQTRDKYQQSLKHNENLMAVLNRVMFQDARSQAVTSLEPNFSHVN